MPIKLVKHDEPKSYRVEDDGELIGWYYEDKRPGSGNSSQYVGYFPPYYVWVWDPDESRVGMTFDSFKEGKDWLQKVYKNGYSNA